MRYCPPTAVLLLCVAIPACSSTKSAKDAGVPDLIFRSGDFEKAIEEQRQELARLRQRVANLDMDLDAARGHLIRARGDKVALLTNVKDRDAAVAMLDGELARRRRMAEESEVKLNSLKRRLAELEAKELSEKDARESAARERQALAGSIHELEAQIAAIDKNIEAVLKGQIEN